MQMKKELDNWVHRTIFRFPKLLDSRFLKGFYLLSGCTHASFFQRRSLFHLKRILLTQFFLEKKKRERKEKEVFLRVFSISSRICIGCMRTYREDTDVLTGKDILETASELVPSLSQVEYSFYEWTSQDFPGTFCYIELEKMRGATLFPKELTELEEKLQEKIRSHTSSLSIFWPHNHEDAYKQLLVLEKEMRSEKDLPQVSIHFKQQTTKYLEFMIYLVRSKTLLSLETEITADRFPSTMHFFSYVNKEIEMDVPFAAEVFSLGISSKNFIVDYTINLLNARMMIAQLLQDVIGPFRDFNGGLLETQKKRFDHLSERFAKKIPNFSLFGERLFYAISPIETQISLGMDMLEKLFCAFSSALSKKNSFCHKPNRYVLIFQSQEVHLLSFYFAEVRKLERKGKITAYVKLEFASYHYLCLLDTTGKHLEQIDGQLRESFPLAQRTLRLTFQCREVPSLCPYHLFREMRGRTISKLLFEGLIRLGPKNKITYAGCMDMLLSEDKQCYLFTIRPHYWSNGERVTAFHYEETWRENFAREKGLNLFYILKNAEAIKRKEKPIHSLGVKAIDGDHLKVELEYPDDCFLEKLAHPLFFPSMERSSESRIFNGPYYVRQKEEQMLLLEKNPYYWDRKNIFFGYIKILFGYPSSKIYRLFQNKKTDWIGHPCTYDIDTSFLSHQKALNLPFFLYFNTENFALSSPFIRRALSEVIDRRQLVTRAFIGSSPLYSLLPHKHPLKVLLLDNDFSKGKELFEKGIKELGIKKKDFPPLKLSSCSLMNHKNIAKYLAEKWEEAFGIQVDLDIQEWNTFYQKIERGMFQIGGFLKSLFAFDPLPFLESFVEQKNNYSRFSHPKYAEIISSIKKERSKEEKKKQMEKAEQFLLYYMPIIPLFTLTHTHACCPGLENYVIGREGEVDFRFASIGPSK